MKWLRFSLRTLVLGTLLAGERAGGAGAVGALGETGDSARGGGDARGRFRRMRRCLMTDGGDGAVQFFGIRRMGGS